ncbi:hypothetical protein FDECE_6373 [Fusarium decemcellulare]|nr:hypothetical protein FDECE_6373 [Fusarium decemcellulare]
MTDHVQGYWPKLQQQMRQDPHGFSEMEIGCAICYEPLNRHPDTERHLVMQPHRDHRGSILPCGHFFGDKCLYDYVKFRWTQFGEPPACPTCSSPQPHHPGCNHLARDRDLPSTLKEAVCIPKLLTQGGTLSEKCSWCQLIDSISKIMIHVYEYGPTPEFWPAVRTSVSFADFFLDGTERKTRGEDETWVFLNHIHQRGELLTFIRDVERQLARSSATHWQSLDFNQVAFRLHRMIQVKNFTPEELLEGTFISTLLGSG